ncbi:MAG TPA: Na/Pi cotransporter family protein [Anaerohalosphaeraceae bacterium]|jgi:phosphate:Na+ symporter|nr:Na/Pi cotransporter family protein [Anaerohalosphaeraceae bacterium]HRT87595.1 Na/Pi cotransporter family protein [Anaerohalosphaeraceae bacterium]
MEVFSMLLAAIGGLGLFLFGMELMSDGLKKVAGKKLKKVLENLTRRPLVAVLVGAGVTAAIQSSSAVTVMVVGFVNAGMLTLKQALCVVFGANIGTTMTAWIVSTTGVLDIAAYALPAIGIGFLMQVACKTLRNKSLGTLILGFGLVFIGIEFLKDAFSPIKESEQTVQALIWLGHNPLLACLAGALFTMLVQSSSASLATLQVLVATGAFGSDWYVAFTSALPFILGDNIGTTITAQIAALRSNRNSKRVAWGHTMFNVFGVCYVLPLVWLGIYPKIIMWLMPGQLGQATIMAYMAFSHSLFNILNTIVFLPMVDLLRKVTLRIVPVTPMEAEEKPVVLETHLLETPELALDQARREIFRMAKRALKALTAATEALAESDPAKINRTRRIEDTVDDSQAEITSYLVALSKRQLNETVSVELPVLLHTVNDLERIGDHAVNIAEIAERKIEQKLPFSDQAVADSEEMIRETDTMFRAVIAAIENNDMQAAHAALESENKLNRMQVDLRRSHVQRMTDGACSAAAGLVFIDLVDNLEKIGDHLTNIAQSIIGGLRWEGLDSGSLSGEYEGLDLEG